MAAETVCDARPHNEIVVPEVINRWTGLIKRGLLDSSNMKRFNGTVKYVSATAAEAAFQWEQLAVAAKELSKWIRERGIDLSKPGMSVGDYQAATFRKTAEALRREAATGAPHYSSCGGPHPPHKHPFIAAGCGCQCKERACLWCGYR